MESLYLVGIAVLALLALVLAIVLFNFFGLWLRARIANAPVSLGKMIGMRLRKVPVGLIVDNRITAVKAGIDVRSDPLEAHYLAGGDVNHVVLALIAADKAGITPRGDGLNALPAAAGRDAAAAAARSPRRPAPAAAALAPAGAAARHPAAPAPVCG